MNIFAFDHDPHTSALWLDDIRKNKMITETGQLLTCYYDKAHSPIFTLRDINRLGYPVSVAKHPCHGWLQKDDLNVIWLVELLRSYLRQWNKEHASSRILNDLGHIYYEQAPHSFVNCAANVSVGVSFKHIMNTNAAYRLYINESWKKGTIKLSWKYGEKPWWAGV